MEGRNGDHLTAPFQCETCHFRNIMGRDPVHYCVEDIEILEFARRASLDAFWDRAAGTIENNFREVRHLEKHCSRLRMPSVVPPMGPYPLEDTVGMQSAICLLERTLRPGVHEEFVQWGTFRKSRSTITNVYQASLGGLQDSIGSFEQKKLWISSVPTHTYWFSRFMGGLHKRVGECVKQDEPVTIDVLLKLERILETEWITVATPQDKKRVAEMGVWFIVGFISGLRGEEMLLIERAGTANSLKFLEDGWFKIIISGATKGNRLSGAKFGLPLVAVTKGSGLQPGKWTQRLCSLLADEKGKRHRLFSRVLSPTKLFEYQNDFYTYLELIQAKTQCIDESCDVRNSYGILRSLRRGVTAHCRNMSVDDKLIKMFNRWRSSIKASQGGGETLDIIERYTKLDAITPALLDYSRQH